MIGRCTNCGTIVARGSSICIKCRSDMLLPQCSYFEYKTENFSTSVPWCNKAGRRALVPAGLQCRWCKGNKKRRIENG